MIQCPSEGCEGGNGDGAGARPQGPQSGCSTGGAEPHPPSCQWEGQETRGEREGWFWGRPSLFFPRKPRTEWQAATEIICIGGFPGYLAASERVPQVSRVAACPFGPGLGGGQNPSKRCGAGDGRNQPRANGAPGSVPAGAVHGGLPVPGALPGEQLQHLRLGRAPQPALRAPVVRGPQQAGQSQAGLQPPRPAPARLHALPAPLPAAPAPRARLHRHPPRKEAPAATAETEGRPEPASEKPWPCQVPAEVSLRVACRGGDAGMGATRHLCGFLGVTSWETCVPSLPQQMRGGSG